MSLLVGDKQTMGKLVQPTNWYRRDTEHTMPTNGAAGQLPVQTATAIYKPTDREADLLLKHGPCQSCRFFSLKEGQERVRGDQVTQSLVFELKLDSMLESVNPADLWNCQVKEYALVHKFSTCESYTPLAAHSSVWNRVKGMIRRAKDEGALP